jgi:hypothetical protein
MQWPPKIEKEVLASKDGGRSNGLHRWSRKYWPLNVEEESMASKLEEENQWLLKMEEETLPFQYGE